MTDKQNPATLDECFEAAELLQEVAVRDKPRGDTQAALDVDAIQSIVDQYFEEVLKNKSYSGRTSRGATWARANDQLNAIRAALTAQQQDTHDDIYQELLHTQGDLEHSRNFAKDLSRQINEMKQELSKVKLENSRLKKGDVNQELLGALKDIANGKWIKNEQLSIEAGQDMFTTDAKTIAKQALARAEQKGGVTLPPHGTTYDIDEE